MIPFFFMQFIHLCGTIGASDGPIAKSSESLAGHKSTGIVPKAATAALPPLISDPVLPTSLAKGMLVLYIFVVYIRCPFLQNNCSY